MAATYKYEELKCAREIRVLHLAPGTKEIRFSLHAVNLDADPAYEAISYCWGDAAGTETVYCEGKTLQVTASLFTALERLRLPDKPRTLWADAVCINQGDIGEKGAQVKLMSQIYSKTSRILIWLGKDMTGLDGVGDSINEALRLLPPDTYDGPELQKISQEFFGNTAELRKQKQPNIYDHDWTPINHLFCRPWFERKWIIQEVVMASDSVPRLMICGDIELPWADVASVAYRLGAYGILLPLAGLSVLNHHAPSMASFWMDGDKPQRNLSNAFMIMLIKHYRRNATLLDSFLATVMFKCTNLRDHVYALLNLANSTGDLEPDYGASIDDVWKRFAITSLVDDQNLKFLALAIYTSSASETGEKLPSWVPSLAAGVTANALTSYTIRPQCFSAGGNVTPTITVSKDHRLLHLRGRVIDTIKATAQSLVDTPIPSDEDILPKTRFISRMVMWKRNWLQGCRDLASGGDWAVLTPGKKREFTKTIICEMTGMRDAAPDEVVDAVEVYMAYLFDYFTAEYVLAESDRVTLRAHAALIEHSVLGLAASLRFCTTESGRFGQASKEAKTGDVFCVLLGAEVPYVLRPTGNGTYRLIGEAYLHGVMHGESMTDERYETVDIALE